MATQITNRATLNYNSGANAFTTTSNTATITMQVPLEISKYSLENEYKINDNITYNVFITNTSINTLTNISVEDDLGTYAINPTMNVTPLTYIGPAKVFINDVYSSTITGVVSPTGDQVTFTIDALATGSSLLLEYKAQVNQYAGTIIGTSQISNIASVTATGVTIPIVATNTIPVASYADITIEKDMSPDLVIDGSTLTYTFNITNYGTIPATNVTVQDTFIPIPVINSVTVDGK